MCVAYRVCLFVIKCLDVLLDLVLQRSGCGVDHVILKYCGPRDIVDIVDHVILKYCGPRDYQI